ncbi:MAG TPA: hypothetical protein VGN98_17225 [Tianweitania sediminis]|jgi:hypothetical protein|nr:hypothetical protein [Tianweitania sediminis]
MTIVHTEPFDMTLSRDRDQRVRDLTSVEQCDQALCVIDGEQALILAQIADDEALPTRPPGWRTKAQNALRYKKRLRTAVLNWRLLLGKGAKQDKRKLLLQVIKEEVGEDDFARFVALASAEHPGVFDGEGGI